MVLVAGELAVPILATRDRPARWHSEHIAERYGLLTIIVLGESVLAGTIAFGSVADDAFSDPELLFLAVGALLLVFAMWWLYFERPSDDLLTSRTRAFEWGYGHYFIWISAAAVGAGIAVGVDVLTDRPLTSRSPGPRSPSPLPSMWPACGCYTMCRGRCLGRAWHWVRSPWFSCCSRP